MRRKLVSGLLVLAILSSFCFCVFAVAISTVSTSTSTTAVSNTQEQGCFKINGVYWAFFSDGTNFKCFSSLDGASWAAATNWTTMAATSANRFDVCVNNVAPFKFAYAWARSSNSYLYFGQGELESDGSVTWDSAGQQTVASNLTTPFYPSIDYDGSGKAWISVYCQSGTAYRIRVYHNTASDGTFTVAAGFPVVVYASTSGVRACILGFTAEGAVCVYVKTTPTLYSVNITGAGVLGAERTASDAAATAVTEWAATKNGNQTMIVYHQTGTNSWFSDTRIANRDTWGTDVQIGALSAAGTYPPTVCCDTATGYYYACIVGVVGGQSHTIYQYISSWSAYDSIADSTYDKATTQISKQAYNSEYCLIWLASGSSPRNVRFYSKSVAVAPSVTYCTVGSWVRGFSMLVCTETKTTTKSTLVKVFSSQSDSVTRTALTFSWLRIFPAQTLQKEIFATKTSLIFLYDSRETEKIIVITLFEVLADEWLRLYSGSEAWKQVETEHDLWLRIYATNQQDKIASATVSGLIQFYETGSSWKQVQSTTPSLIRLYGSRETEKIVVATLIETVAPELVRIYPYTEALIITAVSHLVLVMAILVALGFMFVVIFLAYRRRSE